MRPTCGRRPQDIRAGLGADCNALTSSTTAGDLSASPLSKALAVGQLYADTVPLLGARIAAAVAALATGLCLLSCSRPAADGDTKTTDTNKPVVIGQPEGYNANDVAFADDMITHHQQGIEMSALVPDHSDNPDVVTFAAKSASVLQSDIAVARVLLVQWHENPDAKTGNSSHAAPLKGMADRATITRLNSLRGIEFDTVWLHSMISRDEGAIEMANAEIADGRNVDAIGIAKHVVESQRAEVIQMKRML